MFESFSWIRLKYSYKMFCRLPFVLAVNDDFFAIFFLLANLGFVCSTQFARYFLGAFCKTFYFEFLSNNWKGLAQEAHKEDIFWSVFLTFSLLFLGTSAILIATKTAWERFKESQLQSSINVQLSSSAESHSQKSKKVRYNSSILNEVEIAVYIFLLCIYIVLNVAFEFVDIEVRTIKAYKWRLYRELFSFHIFYKIVLPLVHISYRSEFRKYVQNFLWSMK